jgi:predicted CopG family antitoxin
MAKNIAISDPAYERLRSHKRQGESFSEVVMRLVPPRRPLSEIIEEIRKMGPIDMSDVESDVARGRRELDRRAKAVEKALG